MADARLQALLTLRDQASAGLGTFNTRLESVSRQAKIAGVALSAFGAAGVLAIKGFVSAALEQERAMGVLGATIDAVGQDFDSVRAKIEAATAALQRKTNFGDEEQIRALSQLVPIFGDINQALAALPVLLDASAASGKSLETVVSTMGRALSGATNTSIILGETFEANATFADRLAIAQAKVGGAAEANIDPFVQLSNSIGDLKEVIGQELLPVVVPLINRFRDLVDSIGDLNPKLIQITTFIAGIATVLGLVIGPLLLFIGFLPQLRIGLALVTGQVTLMTGGLNLLIPAIAGVVAVLATLLLRTKSVNKDMEALVDNFAGFQDVLEEIKPQTELDLLVQQLEDIRLIGETFPGLANEMRQALIQGLSPAFGILTEAIEGAEFAIDDLSNAVSLSVGDFDKYQKSITDADTAMRRLVDNVSELAKIQKEFALEIAEGLLTPLDLLEILAERWEDNAKAAEDSVSRQINAIQSLRDFLSGAPAALQEGLGQPGRPGGIQLGALASAFGQDVVTAQKTANAVFNLLEEAGITTNLGAIAGGAQQVGGAIIVTIDGREIAVVEGQAAFIEEQTRSG